MGGKDAGLCFRVPTAGPRQFTPLGIRRHFDDQWIAEEGEEWGRGAFSSPKFPNLLLDMHALHGGEERGMGRHTSTQLLNLH